MVRGILLIIIFVASVYLFVHQKKEEQEKAKKMEEIHKQAQQGILKDIDPMLPDFIQSKYSLQLSKTTISILRKLTNDVNPNVRFSAIELLWQLKDRDIVKIIKNSFETETETEVKLKILEMLSREKSRLSLRLIAYALKDYDKQVRLKTCEIMKDFIDKETIDLLTPALKDYDDDVRQKAMESIKDIKSKIEQQREQKVKEILEPKPIYTVNE